MYRKAVLENGCIYIFSFLPPILISLMTCNIIFIFNSFEKTQIVNMYPLLGWNREYTDVYSRGQHLLIITFKRFFYMPMCSNTLNSHNTVYNTRHRTIR